MEKDYVQKILDLLTEQFTSLIQNDDTGTYSKYSIELANERAMTKEKFYSRNVIFIVVRFLPSYIYYGEAVIPITLKTISEENTIEVAQKLLMEFALTYNLKDNGEGTIKQVYQTPSVTTNYNEIYGGYRTAFYMSGTFVVSEDSNPFDITISSEDDAYDSENPENNVIPLISSGFATTTQADSQPFYSTNGFVDTLGQFRSLGISIATFMTNSAFCNKCLDISLGLNGRTPKDKFHLILTFKNGRTVEKEFTLMSFNIGQKIGEFPNAQMSFSV